MKKILILFIFVMSQLPVVYAYTQENLQWEDFQDIEYSSMKIGDSITVGTYESTYKVEVKDFPPSVRGYKNQNGDIVPDTQVIPSVMLRIYKNGHVAEDIMLKKGESYIVDDDMKIIVQELPGPDSKEWIYQFYDPWILVKLQKVKTPEFDINITTDDRFRYNDEYTNIEVNVINYGAYSRDTNIIVGTSGLNFIQGEKVHSIGSLNTNDNRTVDYKLTLPISYQKVKEYNISVTVSGYDARDKLISNSTFKKLVIGSDKYPTDDIIISKSMKDTVYVGDNFPISLMIVNNGGYDINPVTVSDSINDTFEIIDAKGPQNGLKWDANVGRSWSTSYVVKAKKPGLNIQLPKAMANINVYGVTYTIMSGDTYINIYGPDIVVTKSAKIGKDGDNIADIYLTIMNTGNIGADIYVSDDIPNNSILIKGNTTVSGFLEPESTKTLSYSIMANDSLEKLYIPPVKVYYYLVDNKVKIESNNITGIVRPTPSPTPTKNIEEGTEEENMTEETSAIPLDVKPKTNDNYKYIIGIIFITIIVVYGLIKRIKTGEMNRKIE